MVVASTPTKIRIKQTIREGHIDIVPLGSTDDFLKFSKALQKIISKHESVAQAVDYKEIDKQSLVEETVGKSFHFCLLRN
jgi:hypothetical protein